MMNVVARPGRLPATAGFRAAERIAAIGVSEILKITAVAVQRKQEGRPVIVLGAGEPDFDTPEFIKDAASRAMREGQTKYTALDGSPAMKAAICVKFERDNGLIFGSDEISVSSGSKQVINNAMMATLDQGDEVIMAAPYWVSYADIVRLCGGTPVVVPCSENNGFRLTPEDLEKAITARTRWIIFNSPGNPTGTLYSAQDYRECSMSSRAIRTFGYWQTISTNTLSMTSLPSLLRRNARQNCANAFSPSTACRRSSR
jgi:aspartate aminotransferase